MVIRDLLLAYSNMPHIPCFAFVWTDHIKIVHQPPCAVIDESAGLAHVTSYLVMR